MKKLIALFFLIAVTLSISAQKRYSYGVKLSPVTVASSLTVSVTPKASFSQYELAADTNVTINVVSTTSQPGDLLSFKVKANTRNRTITWGNKIESTSPTITTGKTVTYLFLWNGTNYYLCGSGAAD